MNLELKHFAAYLPYEVQIIEMIRDAERSYKLDPLNIADTVLDATYLKNIRLVLRPLSDFDGKTAVQLKEEYNCKDDIIFWLQELSAYKPGINQLTLEAYFFLLENHFDVFSLIEEGLAVSIHEVKKEEL